MRAEYLSLALSCLLVGSAAAETRGLDDTPEAAFVAQLQGDVFGLDSLLALTPVPDPGACDQSKGRTRGLLTGANEWSGDDRYDLTGTENDTDLMTKALIARGAAQENLRRLLGPDATFAGYSAAATELLSATGCGDSVILHFSGWVMDASFFAPAQSDLGPFLLDAGETASLRDWAGMGLGHKPANVVTEKGPWFLLNQSVPGKADVLSAEALSDLVTRLRNRGADVSVILDTSIAAEMRLEDRQARVEPRVFWQNRLDAEGVTTDPPIMLNSGAGAFSVFYGTAAGEITLELLLPADHPQPQRYGAFSFSMAQSILSQERNSPSALGRLLTDVDLGNGRRDWTYIVSTTAPDRDIIVERRPPAPKDSATIRILSPEETRAAAALDQADILLRGQVEAPAETMIVTVNGKVAASTPDGLFETPITLQAGVNRLDIIAMTRDNNPVTRSIELYYEGDMQALLGTGQRFALIISNQDYPEGSGLSDLKTPHGDAAALASLLTSRYGFQTTAQTVNGEVSLILRDATRIEIEAALYELSRIAGEKDTVLIFYAGHGLYEAATDGAFWLPVDARMGVPYSYLPAAAITDALLRINANNILVISDSCYSGALLRGEAVPEASPDTDRLRALQRLSDRRSRIVIASGGNEPVLDGGGGAHSVFAAALLAGLSEMEEDAFSARELFDRYLLPRTTGRASQEPQYRPIERSGHEGGDVILARLTP